MKASRRAVDPDPAYARRHFLLGWMLAEMPETAEQAAPHLRRAAEELPEAHFHVAQLMAR